MATKAEPDYIDEAIFRTPAEATEARRQNEDRVNRGGLILAHANNDALGRNHSLREEVNPCPAAVGNHEKDQVASPRMAYNLPLVRIERSPYRGQDGLAHVEFLGAPIDGGGGQRQHAKVLWRCLDVTAR